MSGFLKRTKAVETVNPAGGVNPASSPNVSQYGWTSFDAGNVNQLIEYVNISNQNLVAMDEKIAYVDFLINNFQTSQGLVVSVNNKVGVVQLNAEDVGALPSSGPVVIEDLDVSKTFIGSKELSANAYESVRDLELAVNKLGVTLEGTERVEVTFTSAATDEAKKLIEVLKAVPAGAVFCGIVSMDSTKAEISVRQSIARSHIGFSSVGYKEETWNGKTFHVATIGKIGQASKFRMSYYDGTERTVGETLTYLGFRNCRVATNASPRGSGPFPTTINNGKLIPGDPTNTYFIASCFYTPDGGLHVVPHKDELVENVVKNWYYNHGAIQSMHFRYVLVKDGELYDLVGNGYTTETGYSGQPSGRTSIGQHANGQLILAVTDGNTSAGTGVTVKEMSEFMLSKGCVNAMNLDGSGSSTMYVNGELKNQPSDGQERKIPNIIYFQ